MDFGWVEISKAGWMRGLKKLYHEVILLKLED